MNKPDGSERSGEEEPFGFLTPKMRSRMIKERMAEQREKSEAGNNALVVTIVLCGLLGIGIGTLMCVSGFNRGYWMGIISAGLMLEIWAAVMVNGEGE